MTDTLPVGVLFTSAGGSGWTCGYSVGPHTVTCSRPSLGVLTGPNITILVQAPATGGLSLMNLAVVGSGAYDPDPSNNTASAGTQVIYGLYLPLVSR